MNLCILIEMAGGALSLIPCGERAMSTTEVLEQLKRMTNAERLEVIEAATRLLREALGEQTMNPREDQERRLRASALALKELYKPGGEMTEWTSLDGEEFLDDYVPG
jgi:hypothetical protein